MSHKQSGSTPEQANMSQLPDKDCIADDTLRGAAAIAQHIGESERRTNYLLEQGKLPAFRVGKCWRMRKSTYRTYIARLEAEVMSKVYA